MEKLDRGWLQANPLPPLAPGGDKNARGRVLVVGGAEFVPGALRLTGEAALRAGAGKVQMATVRAAAMSLAVLVPEAAMIALPANDEGEIAPRAAELLKEHLEHCDTLVFAPGCQPAKTPRSWWRPCLVTPRASSLSCSTLPRSPASAISGSSSPGAAAK